MPKEIYIPFKPKMLHALLGGEKKCTSRTKQYGQVGDMFKLFVAPTIYKHNTDVITQDRETGKLINITRMFRLTKIELRKMQYIRNNLFKEEGFCSPEEFQQYLVNIVGLKWDGNRELFVHWFEEVKQ